MDGNNPLHDLKRDPRYHTAADLLSTILHREKPDPGLLRRHFGNLAPSVASRLEAHFAAFPMRKARVREHHRDPSVITRARRALEENPAYARLQSAVLADEVPPIDDITPLYGGYASTVRDILALYNKSGLKRTCGLPAAAHPSRVGALVSTLGFDSPGSSMYCTIAFLHDCLEDLILVEHRRSTDHHGLRGLEAFVDDHIPPELQPNVRLLTNRYSLILNYLGYLLTLSDTPSTRANLLKAMEGLSTWEWSLQDTVRKLSALLNRSDLEEPALVNAKWQCYRDLYIREMADDALSLSDFRTFEIKAIDLCDNAHGSAALSEPDKIKNILKLGIWATQGYRMHTSWTPTNNFIQELLEYALVYAEGLVLKDFLEPASKLDFFVSGLLKLEHLRSIFYLEEL